MEKYNGNKVMHISIDDIESKVKENIISYSAWINRYVDVINDSLDSRFKLDTDRLLFDIKREYGEKASFKDDGNTYCEGFNYDVLWAYPLNNANTDEWHLRQGYAEGYLYFIYNDRERLFDHQVKESRFFSIYLAGIKLPREDNHVARIDYNNSNMSLNSVLNKGNIVSIILKIRELQKKVELMNYIESIELFRGKE